MTNLGPVLINAIANNTKLKSIKDCPGVSAHIGHAFYGAWQDDSNSMNIGSKKDINKVIGFSGANSETAVWHFRTSSPVHHFVVVPWYKHDFPHGQVYSVFMAYENKYSLGNYVNGTGLDPIDPPVWGAGKGYKNFWTIMQLSKMLSALIKGGTSRKDYFGVAGVETAKMKCWKYRVIPLNATLIERVRNYT